MAIVVLVRGYEVWPILNIHTENWHLLSSGSDKEGSCGYTSNSFLPTTVGQQSCLVKEVVSGFCCVVVIKCNMMMIITRSWRLLVGPSCVYVCKGKGGRFDCTCWLCTHSSCHQAAAAAAVEVNHSAIYRRGRAFFRLAFLLPASISLKQAFYFISAIFSICFALQFVRYNQLLGIGSTK